MRTVATFYPRGRNAMGTVFVQVRVDNFLDPGHALEFTGLIDTGAFGLILPTAWKERLGVLRTSTMVAVETADQRIVEVEVCGPVEIRLAGGRTINGEVAFMEMEPRNGCYEPLVGYTILELAGVVVDMVSHRLEARKYFDAKAATA